MFTLCQWHAHIEKGSTTTNAGSKSGIGRVYTLANVLQCKASQFPMTRLGLPLSDKTLPKSTYQPLLQKIQKKLTGWKAALLCSGGRLTLLNSILTAMPVFFHVNFSSSKMGNIIDWQDSKEMLIAWAQGNAGAKETNVLANWRLITRPKQLGGLGFRDIEEVNISPLAMNVTMGTWKSTLVERGHSNQSNACKTLGDWTSITFLERLN